MIWLGFGVGEERIAFELRKGKNCKKKENIVG